MNRWRPGFGWRCLTEETSGDRLTGQAATIFSDVSERLGTMEGVIVVPLRLFSASLAFATTIARRTF